MVGTIIAYAITQKMQWLCSRDRGNKKEMQENPQRADGTQKPFEVFQWLSNTAKVWRTLKWLDNLPKMWQSRQRSAKRISAINWRYYAAAERKKPIEYVNCIPPRPEKQGFINIALLQCPVTCNATYKAGPKSLKQTARRGCSTWNKIKQNTMKKMLSLIILSFEFMTIFILFPFSPLFRLHRAGLWGCKYFGPAFGKTFLPFLDIHALTKYMLLY